jgi:hypothetical protein
MHLGRVGHQTVESPFGPYVLIALGGLLFIGLGVFVWRRQRRTREVVKDTDTRDDGYAEDMEEIDENRVIDILFNREIWQINCSFIRVVAGIYCRLHTVSEISVY